MQQLIIRSNSRGPGGTPALKITIVAMNVITTTTTLTMSINVTIAVTFIIAFALNLGPGGTPTIAYLYHYHYHNYDDDVLSHAYQLIHSKYISVNSNLLVALVTLGCMVVLQQ